MSGSAKQVLLAKPRGYCAGVDRAVEAVEQALDQYGAPVYVRKEIVHNKHVVETLRERGAIFVDEASEVPEGAHVVFSAHGVSPAVRDEAAGRNLQTIDATCPLVTKVHQEAKRFAREDYDILLVGHHGHTRRSRAPRVRRRSTSSSWRPRRTSRTSRCATPRRSSGSRRPH